MSTAPERRVLLIVSGGIAAYKALELIRLLRRRAIGVSCVLTENGARFVTAVTLEALTEDKVHTDLFSLTRDSRMGHIELSRAADLLVVAPASANILARMANGLADDLATDVLLATDKPVLVAPAMNVRMWHHPATRNNIALLRARGVAFVGPDEGPMACNEYGLGRLAEPPAILDAILALLDPPRRLAGCHALVTSGPTQEPIDPVRFIANRSSGRQGHAVAAALVQLGAHVTLVSGPVHEPDPPGARVVRVTTAAEMLQACHEALPADVAVCVAAVADWRVAEAASVKLKKGGAPPTLTLVPNPDILATLGRHATLRPRLVVGFAAETNDVAANAVAKRVRKNCDWVVANDVRPETGIMGGDANEVLLVTDAGIETWPRLSKADVARRLAGRIADTLEAEK